MFKHNVPGLHCPFRASLFVLLFCFFRVSFLDATPVPEVHNIAWAHAAESPSTTDLIQLRGVVTAFSGWKNSFFLEDASGAISVDRLENAPLQVGDEVQVSGHLKPGLFANIILSEQVSVLGHPGLPKPHVATYEELQTGEFDSKLVAFSGTVQAARFADIWGKKMLLLDLQVGNAALSVYLLHYPDRDFAWLVDSQIRVTGVCGTIFNSRRQLIGLRIFAPDLAQITVTAKGPDLAAIPVSPLDSLLTFHGTPLDHRVHVQGVVTYQAPGHELFLQEGQTAIRVISPSDEILAPGTRAEAWGFVAREGYSADLKNGLIHNLGRGVPVAPIPIQASDVIKMEDGFRQAPYDGLLVQTEAHILDRLPNTGSLLWTLEANDVRFDVAINNGPRDWALAFESGTRVLITGICVAEIDQTKNLNSFHLLLRSPADMTVVRGPYWSQSFLLLLATYLLILIGSVLAYLLQRRQSVNPTPFTHAAQLRNRTEEGCRRLSRYLAVLSLALGGAVFFVDFSASSTGIALLPGPAILLAALGLLLFRSTRPLLLLANKICCWIVLLAGASAVLDGFIASSAGAPGLATAFALLLIGCAALSTNSRRFVNVGQIASVIVAFTALPKLVATLYGAGNVGGMATHLIMSTPSALAFLSLSLAHLLATPEKGLMKTVSSPRLGGLLLRRLIPAAVIGPIIIGWIRLQLQLLGFLDTRFGLTLFALSSTLCFCFLIWTSSALLNRLDELESKTEEKLREREGQLELVFETGSMGDWVWNLENDMVSAHKSVWRLYGEPEKEGSEPIEWFRRRQHPDDQSLIGDELKKADLQKRPLSLEFRVVWPDTSIHWIYCRAVVVHDKTGKLLQVNGINLDITDRKIFETRLKRSLAEKEALLKEVHHRVKNNLTIVSSFLSLQAATIDNREAIDKLLDSERRVRSMAIIHEQLYQQDDVSSINFVQYAQQLIEQVFYSYTPSALVTYRLEAVPTMLSIDQSIPCGLILNELLTNALKYAYPQGEGEILIRIAADNDSISIGVADQGVGMPPGLDWRESKSLGMKIIDALAAQLEGSIEVGAPPGASFTVRFARQPACVA